MRYLLDVNVMVAWGWADHPHHKKVDKWITEQMAPGSMIFHTSLIIELGFVRVSMQRSLGKISIAQAMAVLTRQRERFVYRISLLPDDLSSCREFPDWCTHAKHTTDSHLLALAQRHKLQLATLDTSIPGAFVIPEF